MISTHAIDASLISDLDIARAIAQKYAGSAGWLRYPASFSSAAAPTLAIVDGRLEQHLDRRHRIRQGESLFPLFQRKAVSDDPL